MLIKFSTESNASGILNNKPESSEQTEKFSLSKILMRPLVMPLAPQQD